MPAVDSRPKVCVIGAGSSGIPVIKALADREIPFDCFEKSDQVGGNWCIRNKNGMSGPRHTMQVDFNPFVHRLEVATKEGRRRAGKQGQGA